MHLPQVGLFPEPAYCKFEMMIPSEEFAISIFPTFLTFGFSHRGHQCRARLPKCLVPEKPVSRLPKNGESRLDSVGFCRIHACNIGPSRLPQTLTVVLSMDSEVPRGTRTAGIRFALSFVTNEIGFPGWPEPILDSVTGLGRQLRKGGLHQPPFSFLPSASYPEPCQDTLAPAPPSALS